MKTTLTPTSSALQILTTSLGENDVGATAAQRISNQTWDRVMVTTARQSPAKHKQPVKAKVAAPARKAAKVTPISSPALITQLEIGLDMRLQAIAHDLLTKFDLSTGTAKTNSHGTKNFRSHNLLSKIGESKKGDHQKKKRVLLDRYISYRVGDHAFKLVCLLINDRDPLGVRFQVEGDPVFFKKDTFKSPKELRPYLTKADNMGAAHGGREFKSFPQAAAFFEKMIAKVAPRIH